ncbi:MAG: DNA polymerase [Peptococcaceae bacterium]|nr:DNA polymerase [Peptococcaceae bacterium]
MTSYKRTLAIDIETFSDADLGAVGVYKYTDTPAFEIMLVAYAFDDEPVALVDLTQEEMPAELLAALTDPSVLKTAFNAQFERVCLNAAFGIDSGPWECTMIRAWEAGIAGNLATVGARLGISEEERKLDGGYLIRLFCRPRKPSKTNPDTRWTAATKPEEWLAFVIYCMRDVAAERAIRERLLKIPMLEAEHALYQLDQRINDRGIRVDVDFCRAAIQISDAITEAAEEKYARLTGTSSPRQVAALKAWIFDQTGETVESITKETLPELVAQFGDYPDVCEALRLRALLGKSSIAKYKKMLETAASVDHRSRGNTQFFGAHTGRWAGRLIQLQNLSRNNLSDLDTARQAVASGDSDLLALLYDDPTDILRQCIRTAIVPEEGKQFIVADFSAIEARVIAWLAGESWRLDTFAAGGDIYCASASQMFGVPVVKHGENGHLRQKGKVAELALGYAGSTGALKAMGALKMGMEEAELAPIVEKWRKASPKIVALWHAIEDACVGCVSDHRPRRINKFLSVLWEHGLLFVVLPSGRRMGYARPRLSPDAYGRQKLSYEDVAGGKVKRIETYYGKLTENIVQATARDCLAHGMLALEAAGYEIVFHVHDEVIVETSADDDVVADVCRIMSADIPWAPGLPLNADGYACQYYKKD